MDPKKQSKPGQRTPPKSQADQDKDENLYNGWPTQMGLTRDPRTLVEKDRAKNGSIDSDIELPKDTPENKLPPGRTGFSDLELYLLRRKRQ